MRALTVLTLGVCLTIGLQAEDLNIAATPDVVATGTAWSARRDAARTAMQERRFADAAQLYGECVGLAANDADLTDALSLYGIMLYRAGRNAEARVALERALSLPERRTPGDTPVSGVRGVLALVDLNLGDYTTAERILRVAVADPSATPGVRVMAMVSLADLLREEARNAEALAVLNDANRLTGLSPAQRTSVMVEAAELHREMHSWDAAVAAWNELLATAELQHSDRLEAIATGGLGETWYDAGNLARAEPLLRRSLQLLRRNPEVPPSQLSTALALVARLYADEGKLALAADAVDEAIAKDEMSLGPNHPQVAMLLELRADILSRRGDAGDAQRAREQLATARTIMTGHFGPVSTAVAGVLAALGDVEERDGHAAAAVLDYSSAMDMLRSAGLDTAHFGHGLLARYAAALKAAHRGDEARTLLKATKIADAQSFR